MIFYFAVEKMNGECKIGDTDTYSTRPKAQISNFCLLKELGTKRQKLEVDRREKTGKGRVKYGK